MISIVNTRVGKFLVFENDALGRILHDKADFEPHFLDIAQNIISPGDLCIDLGANLGYHAVSMAKLTGQVHAFEPLRVIFNQLCGNAFLNDMRNIHTHNEAVGACNAIVQMDAVDYDQNQVNIGCTKIGNGGDSVLMISLDTMGLQNVKFIKVDIQGSEENFLIGARTTIATSRPVMFIEIEEYLLRCFGSSSEKLINKLLSMNYVLVRIMNDYPCDHLAVPAEQEHLIGTYMKGIMCPLHIIKGNTVKVNMDHPTHQWAIYGSLEITS